MTSRALSDECVALRHGDCDETATAEGLRTFCKCACHKLEQERRMLRVKRYVARRARAD